MRTEIREEIAHIEPHDQIEENSIGETLSWIDSDAELCRLEKPATPPKHLVSYFVVVDGDHLLLVDHINAKLWLPTGGHVEPGEHPRTTALREAKEELSIDAEFLQENPLFLTVTETVGQTAGHIDVSIWYLFKGDRASKLDFDESEFHSIRWFHKDDVPLNRTDKNMARFLKKMYG